MAAVGPLKVFDGLNTCLPTAGMNSGFSGARRATSSARRTAFSSDLSSNWLTEAVPWRLPKATLMVIWVFSCRPAVVTLFCA